MKSVKSIKRLEITVKSFRCCLHPYKRSISNKFLFQKTGPGVSSGDMPRCLLGKLSGHEVCF